MTTQPRVRVGVAGLGVVAQAVHLPLLARRWDLFEVTALCDLSASLCATLGERYGVPVDQRYSSVDDMCEGVALDAVLVLTSGSHGAAVARCVDAGLAVLCEKPFAYSVAEADAVIARAGDRPRVQVAYMKQYDGAFGRLRCGVTVARRAWLTPADVLNTRSVEDFRSALRSASARAVSGQA